MTIEELKGKVPEAFAPWVDAYGPSLLAMSKKELMDWIHLLLAGQTYDAYKKLTESMTMEELIVEADILIGDWEAANLANAERMELQKAAATGILKIILTIALATVGL